MFPVPRRPMIHISYLNGRFLERLSFSISYDISVFGFLVYIDGTLAHIVAFFIIHRVESMVWRAADSCQCAEHFSNE